MYRISLAALVLAACDPAAAPPGGADPVDTGVVEAPTEPAEEETEGPVPTEPGETEPDPGTVPAEDTGEAPVEPPGLSYAADVEPILAAACAGCHLGGGASGGFSFDGGTADLIGVPSSNGMPYVTADDPDQSYLLHKIAGTQASAGGSGSRMPIGSVLPAEDLDVVEAWILDGALP